MWSIAVLAYEIGFRADFRRISRHRVDQIVRSDMEGRPLNNTAVGLDRNPASQNKPHPDRVRRAQWQTRCHPSTDPAY